MVSLAAGLVGSHASADSFDARLNSVVKPYRFSIAGWEVKTIGGDVGRWFLGKPAQANDEITLVNGYFDAVKRIDLLKSKIAAADAGGQGTAVQIEELERLREWQSTQAPRVERIIQKQIRETLAGQGIYNPAASLKVSFPPVSFRLQETPDVLVISPKNKIEAMREVVLRQQLSTGQKEAIEAGADRLGVSSLVTEIGGMATYPTLVDGETSLRAAIDTATHEWLHQYLAFTPLGFRYVLDEMGIKRNYDIATMNESLANLAGKEIGDMVYQRYYAKAERSANKTTKSEFDFNQEMRNIRETVDAYLAKGEIGPAEAFMEQKRQELAANGYYIRKLNQAYFAFYGSYADNPAFLNPIGHDLKELRSRSASLKDFLSKTARMTSRQDLAASLK